MAPPPSRLFPELIDQLQLAQRDVVNTKGHVVHDTTMLDLHHKLGRNTTHDSGYTHHRGCMDAACIEALVKTGVGSVTLEHLPYSWMYMYGHSLIHRPSVFCLHYGTYRSNMLFLIGRCGLTVGCMDTALYTGPWILHFFKWDRTKAG